MPITSKYLKQPTFTFQLLDRRETTPFEQLYKDVRLTLTNFVVRNYRFVSAKKYERSGKFGVDFCLSVRGDFMFMSHWQTFLINVIKCCFHLKIN